MTVVLISHSARKNEKNKLNYLTKTRFNAIILKHSLGGVAQLVERLICIQEVIGSNPFISTSTKSESSKRIVGSKYFHFEDSKLNIIVA